MPFDLCRIGQLLRETREKRGLTFDDVSNALFIKEEAIKAIEAGDWDNLPHPVYVKGYVTQYAAFLHMLDLLKAASREDESPVQEPEGTSKRKRRILRGWKLRKKEAQESRPPNVPWSVIDQL